MGNFFGGSSTNGRVKVIVKDLRTGRPVSIDVQKPFEQNINYLLEQVVSKFPKAADRVEKEHISLKYKKKDITKGDVSTTIGEALGLTSVETNTTVNLYFERKRGGVSRDWIVYIKTLTGKVFDVSFYDPQEVSVMGLKLLIEEEYNGEIKPEQMRLVLDSQQLDDSTLIHNISGASNECTIHLVMKGN